MSTIAQTTIVNHTELSNGVSGTVSASPAKFIKEMIRSKTNYKSISLTQTLHMVNTVTCPLQSWLRLNQNSQQFTNRAFWRFSDLDRSCHSQNADVFVYGLCKRALNVLYKYDGGLQIAKTPVCKEGRYCQ